ncbi:MAG: bifunctional folylpolyglutamate synthase/dihydrofolate synthase, partial [Chloroflexota bacterium]|nr:bifunctional folylpolyglutamate synthase/dihydrofolate synthase [Chloroflexota bacterium]
MPRTRALLDLAGAPDRRMTCVLVAGTKGKGSTAALLASVLHAAGVRAGLYTSPHLQSWRERIRVDGMAVAPRAFERAMRAAAGLVPALRRDRALGEPSAFELLTVAALTRFAREKCAVAILEVGLGGRFDATNAVEPALSIVTLIDLDHRAILGSTLARIAREKAGVLRRDRPALLARQRPAAERALRAECER